MIVSADAPARGRARALQLTRLGKRRLNVSHAAVAGVESAMLQGISASMREKLSQLLTVCAENLDAIS